MINFLKRYIHFFRMSTLHEENITSRDSEDDYEADNKVSVKDGMEIGVRKATKEHDGVKSGVRLSSSSEDARSKLSNLASLSELGASSKLVMGQSEASMTLADQSEASITQTDQSGAGSKLGQSEASINQTDQSGAGKIVTGSPGILSSGYGSQAASSSNLSSEDSLSLKSISVDETPETETNNVMSELASDLMSAPCVLESLLSTPDVSAVSLTPGEDTEDTVTETTPSSTNITPSLSGELPGLNGGQDQAVVHRNKDRRLTLSQRLSCPNNLLSQCEAEAGSPVIRSCRRSVPDMNHNTETGEAPAWMRLGESVQVMIIY